MQERIMAEYPKHIVKEIDWNSYAWCERCDEDLTIARFPDDPYLDQEKASQPCQIIGTYSEDGKVLLSVAAEDDWLREHWEELVVKFGVD
jgi:hypothetical protein